MPIGKTAGKVEARLMRLVLALFFSSLVVFPVSAAQIDHASRVASLIDRAKLATLGKRAANPRIQKAVYWLAIGRSEGENLNNLLNRAAALAGYTGAAGSLTRDALLRNLDFAEKLGCLNEAGLAEMRRGRAATVVKGPYVGDQLSVDHIIPRALVPELDNVIANLELMPLRMNQRKNSHVGARQRDLAQKLFAAGLLSRAGRDAVVR